MKIHEIQHIYNKFYFLKYLLTCFFCLSLSFIYAQANNSSTENNKPSAEVDSRFREELHRYIGYEENLPKYISLPYDVVMNTNVGGQPFVDVGLLWLMFLPLILLWGLKDKVLKILLALGLIVFLIVSMPTGYASANQITAEKVSENIANALNEVSFNTSPVAYLKLKITQLTNTLYQPIQHEIVNNFSGEGDYITYPLFIVFFLGVFFLLRKRSENLSSTEKTLLYFSLLYGFLWHILSTGIIWYGILIVPLGVILTGLSLRYMKDKLFLRNSFMILSALWIIASLPYRFSNYNLSSTNPELNKGAIHAGPLLYGIGQKTKVDLIDFLYPKYAPVIAEINNNPEARVYRIGTYFHYFISRNNERVYEDNQLGNIDNLIRANTDKNKIIQTLKGYGYEYLIVDLNLASIDRTPEGSLREKAKRFQGFLQGNSNLQLIGTDVVVENSAGQRINSIYGVKLIKEGNFAAFKIK